MKATVVKAATTKKKPSNYCPWMIDDSPTDKK